MYPRASTAANPASSASTRQVGFSASNTCSIRNPSKPRHGQDSSNQRQNQLVGPNAAMTSVAVFVMSASGITGSLQAPLRSLHTLPAHVEDGMPILATMQYAVTSPMGCQAVAPGGPWRRLSRLQHHGYSITVASKCGLQTTFAASGPHKPIGGQPCLTEASASSPKPCCCRLLFTRPGIAARFAARGPGECSAQDRHWFAVFMLLVGVKCCCVSKCQCICLLGL